MDDNERANPYDKGKMSDKATAELTWTFVGENWEAPGADDKGLYVIYHYGHSGKVWRCEYYPFPGAFNAVSEIWLGDDIEVCKAKAWADHLRRVQRIGEDCWSARWLAWKRYMAQNDPPE